MNDDPAAVALLEPENDSSRWLRRVGPVVGVEGPDTKIGVLIYIAPVLGPQRDAFGQRVIDPAAVHKSAFRLSVSPGHEASSITRWMEYQTAASAKNVRIDSPDRERKIYHQVGRGRVHVGLNSRKPAD